MAVFIAAMGLVLIGAIGGASALMFLGFRLPMQHEKRMLRLLENVERLAKQVGRI